MKRFAGQTVFVTGGNKGIGRGIAKRFADEGASIAIAAIEKETPEAAAALAQETGSKVIGLALDVTDAKAVQEAYGEAEAKLGTLSVSVQNAGVITIAKVENLTEREWDLNLDVNTKGVFLCSFHWTRKRRLEQPAGHLPIAGNFDPTMLPPRQFGRWVSPEDYPDMPVLKPGSKPTGTGAIGDGITGTGKVIRP